MMHPMRLVTFVVVLLAAAAPALAQVGDEELARAHYLTAQSYYNQGRVDEALQNFNEAYRLSKRPAFHYNIAICQEKLGRIPEAVASYERYLAESPAATDATEVRAHIDVLKARLQPAPAPSPRPELTAAK